MMKKLLLLAFITMSFLCIHAQYPNAKNYIETYKELAINEMIRTGVPASIILAQGILETEAGTSELVARSNNHFGIKCKTDWTGNVVYHDDDAKGECFRSYTTPEDSYRDHSDFLKNRPNYAFLFNLDPTDYEGWAKGLKKAGYATNPAYSQMLIKIIFDNNLQDYTLIALQKEQQINKEIFALKPMPSTGEEAFVSPAASTHSIAEDFASNDVPFAKAAQTIIKAPTYPNTIFEINQTKVIYVHTGVSLFALANNFGIAYNKLLEFNEMQDKEILDKDQLIYLDKKPKKGTTEVHIVTPNETMEYIAQAEGVRLESLLEYNRIPKGLQPVAGEKIYLQYNAPATPKLSPSKGEVTIK